MQLKMKFVSVVPNDLRFVWETEVFISNLREMDYSSRAHILVFVTKEGEIHEGWSRLQKEYPEANFFFYRDMHHIEKVMTSFNYIPLLRLYVLQEHWKKHAYLKDYAILYTDTDILFTRPLDFTPFLKEDNTCYLSWTGNKERTDNYLWQPYLDSKIDNVNPQKLEQYKKLDIVSRLGYITGITREIITENNPNTGGAQYLLKNITSQFWTDCFNTCCEIKMYLSDINQIFMKGNTFIERENNGVQAWASDMWTLLYNIWAVGMKTKCPPELDFAWSTDSIDKINDYYLLHNAGCDSSKKIKVAFEKDENGKPIELEAPLFFKGDYRFLDKTPFDLEFKQELENIVNHPVSSKFCNSYYVQKILNIANGRNL